MENAYIEHIINSDDCIYYIYDPKISIVPEEFQSKNASGKWDMGSVVNDKVYFPLSDSWRKAEIREADCTERISRILNKLNKKSEEKNGHYN